MGDSATLSAKYLVKDKVYALDNHARSPANGLGFFGLDAGKVSPIDHGSRGGYYKYSLGPLSIDDWSQKGDPALTERTIEGFWARTFAVSGVDDNIPFGDGLFFKRNEDGTQTVLSGGSKLYDFTNSDHPVLKVGNKQFP